MEVLQKLKKITDIIIKDEVIYFELKDALEELKHLFLNISGLDFELLENQEHILLNTGMAIGPKWAGMCIDDLMRTKRFICGVNKELQHLRQTKKDERKLKSRLCTRNGHMAIFQRLSQCLDHVTSKFGQLIEEQDTVVSERRFSRLRTRPATN